MTLIYCDNNNLDKMQPSKTWGQLINLGASSPLIINIHIKSVSWLPLPHNKISKPLGWDYYPILILDYLSSASTNHEIGFYIWLLKTGVPTVSQISRRDSLLKSINDFFQVQLGPAFRIQNIWLKCTLYPFTIVGDAI